MIKVIYAGSTCGKTTFLEKNNYLTSSNGFCRHGKLTITDTDLMLVDYLGENYPKKSYKPFSLQGWNEMSKELRNSFLTYLCHTFETMRSSDDQFLVFTRIANLPSHYYDLSFERPYGEMILNFAKRQFECQKKGLSASDFDLLSKNTHRSESTILRPDKYLLDYESLFYSLFPVNNPIKPFNESKSDEPSIQLSSISKVNKPSTKTRKANGDIDILFEKLTNLEDRVNLMSEQTFRRPNENQRRTSFINEFNSMMTAATADFGTSTVEDIVRLYFNEY